jgi:chemotaxis protein CheD
MAKFKDFVDIPLHPSEYFVADADYQVRALLGSCVSMTLWHPACHISTMSHFLLRVHDQVVRAVQEIDGRYRDKALELMCPELVGSGVRLLQCQAKLTPSAG